MDKAFPYLSLRERDRRWAALRAMMAREDMDCLIAFGLKGREHYEGYVANEYIEGLAILPREGEPAVVSWHPKMVIRRQGKGLDARRFWIGDARIGPYGREVVAFLRERGLARGRIGAVGLSVGEAGSPGGIVGYGDWKVVLEALPEATLVDATWQMREVMLVKSEEELCVLRHCAALGERACAAMLAVAKPGASEHALYAAIHDAIHAGGGVSHDPFLIMTWGAEDIGWAEPAWIVQGGPPRRMEPGDLVMAELFPAYGGLETQQQVSVALEPVPEILRELGGAAEECYRAGLAALRPGNTFNGLWGAMLEPLRARDLWSLTPMIHSVAPLGWVGGMGFNLERMPEQLQHWRGCFPLAMGDRDFTLLEGMSFAFEPNACAGQRRVNVGGTVVVGRDGPIELNNLPNRFHIVG